MCKCRVGQDAGSDRSVRIALGPLATVSRGFLALMVLVLASPAWAASTADAPLAPVLEPLLAGEFYLQQGDYPRAAEQYLVAAQQSSDPAVARRATAADRSEERRVGKAWGRPGSSRWSRWLHKKEHT